MNLSEIQGLIKSFTEDKRIDSSVEVRIIDLASEVGSYQKRF